MKKSIYNLSAKILPVMLVLLLLLLSPALAGSADLTLLPKAAGPAPVSLDTNFNKIFDDLENMMAPATL